MKEIVDNFDRRQKKRYEHNKARNCHRIFKTSDYEGQKNINSNRTKETCQWVFKHSRYRKWNDNSKNDLLWISANSKCEKSILSKSLIDHDLSKNQTNRVCYFFFKNNENQDSLVLVLCALIHQLFIDQFKLIQYAMSFWDKNEDKIQREVDELWRILLSASRDVKTSKTIYVLDALDECEENDRKRLIAMLVVFSRNRSTHSRRIEWIKFLITNRSYNWIQDQFQDQFQKTLQSWSSIRLREENENDQIRQEIDLIVQAKMSNLILNVETKEKLKKKLLAMKHRTYLWLYLIIEEMKDTYRESLRSRKASILLLFATIEDAYEKILKRETIRNKENVRKILRIVIDVRRSLTINEMTTTFDVDTSSSTKLKMNVEKIHLKTNIRQWCDLFVFINHSRIYFIHQIAKKFLIRESIVVMTNNQNWKHCLSTMKVEESMIRICVRYLLQKYSNLNLSKTNSCTFKESMHFIIKIHTIDNSNNTNTLWIYSTENWTNHARSIQDETFLFSTNMIIELHDIATQRFEHWFSIFWKTIASYDERSKMNDIRLAILNEHNDIFQRLLETNEFDRDATNEKEQTTLIFESKYDYVDVMRILLNKEVDVNVQDEQYDIALRATSQKRHDQMMQMLFKNEIDVNVQNAFYVIVLQTTSQKNYDQIM